MHFRSLCLLVTLMCAGLTASGQLYVTIPIADGIAQHFGVSPETAALVGTIFGVAYSMGFLLWGPVSDRYGRQIVLVLGVAATSAATLGVAFASNFQWELVARGVQGVCAASIAPIGLAMIGESLPVALRPTGLAMMSFSFIAAAPIAQMYAQETQLAFPALMATGAVSYAACAFALALLGWKRNDHGDHRPHLVSSSISLLVRDPVILTAWLISPVVLFSFVVFQVSLHGVIDTQGWDSAWIRGLTLFGMLGSFLTGSIIKKIGGITTTRIGLFVSAIALVMAAVWQPLLPVSVVMLSLGISITLPGIISTISQHANHASRGLAIAIYSFSVFLGASLAPMFVQRVPVSAHSVLFPPVVLLLLAAACISLPWIRIPGRRHLK
jgi:YNFM family putative membrane transporter